MSNWFEVDRKGLAKLLERRGKEWILAELLQNAWDAPGVSQVNLTVEPVPNLPLAQVQVEDDSPEGFSDLAHAFTLFGESVKKSDPQLRGRFNLGEKMVLAFCRKAEIATTKGRVVFDENGRSESRRRIRERGTCFDAVVEMTREELASTLEAVSSFIAPDGIETRVNGAVLKPRPALREIDVVLPTEVADEDGVLRRSRRRTTVRVFEPLEGRKGRIYEMGIPIVETGDRFDVDIAQKVPLSLERDSVTPAYLREVRVAVLNSSADLVTDASDPWVGDALESANAAPEAVSSVIRSRFGDKAVIYDPSDKESNDRAAAAGYRVVHGGSFSAAQWENVRRAGSLLPAGKVTPTPKPFDPNGDPAEHVEPTPSMEAFSEFCKELGRRLLDAEIEVDYLKYFNAVAAYGGRRLSFNISRLGCKWFEGPLRPEQLDLVIHEFGHHFEMNHFSKKYNDALTRLGAAATFLAIEHPHVFDLEQYGLAPAPGMR